MFSFLEQYWWAVLLGGTCLVEIVPVKINPVSTFLKWAGRKLTGPITDRLDKMEKDIEENEKDRIRYTVLDFSNSCRNGRRHTKEEFAHIFQLNQKYESLMRRFGGVNQVYKVELEYLNELYRELVENNGFL